MSSTIVSMPSSRAQFEAQLSELLKGLESEHRRARGGRLTNEVIAKHFLDASKDRVKPSAGGDTGSDATVTSTAEVSLEQAETMEVTKTDSLAVAFRGNTDGSYLLRALLHALTMMHR